MIMFLLVFLTLYGGLNFYVYHTIASGLGHHSWPAAAVLGFLVFSPFLLRLFEKRQNTRIATALAWLAYNWMGIAFLFACFALLCDVGQLVFPRIADAEALVGTTGLTVMASLYGFYESRHVGINKLSVRSPKLENDGAGPFRIVQISDLHLGYGTLPGHIRKILDQVRTLNPDLVVSTGDLFDSNLENLDEFAQLLKSVHPPKGKIAVTGNHEAYAGLPQALDLTERSGFRALRSAAEEVAPHLFVAGVDDPEALEGESREAAEKKALRQVPEGAFAILLKHRPDITASTIDQFDLQLSGHTHGGQIFPFIFLTRLQYRAKHGLSKVADETFLYLSHGTGTWGPQIRLFAPPEITVFDFFHGSEFSISERLDGSQENDDRDAKTHSFRNRIRP